MATEQLAAELERKASRVRAGIIVPAEEHARRPLADHLNDYAAALEAREYRRPCQANRRTLPTGESFTPAEAAGLLGISVAAVRTAMKKLKPAATGYGKFRAFRASALSNLTRPTSTWTGRP